MCLGLGLLRLLGVWSIMSPWKMVHGMVTVCGRLCVLFVLCENCIVDASIFFFCNAIFCCCVFVHLMILPDCASMRCPFKWVVCVVCVLCELL